MNWMDVLFHVTEIIGTIAFAVSGAMVAVRKRMDLFGVLFLGGVTALGGGTVRDVLLGSCPPKMFYSFEFLLIATISSLIIFLIAYRWHDAYTVNEVKINQINNVFDAIGLAAFVVTGTQAAITAGYGDNVFLCIFLGTTTGVGGGVLRDMMCQEMPGVLRKHIYAVAAIVGGLVYYYLLFFGAGSTLATLLSMGITVATRLLATHYRWSLPRIPD
jgi:uncharacterized membrane protein YeiH